MAWYVHFIPNECDSISVLVNNEYWTKWFRTSGDQKYPLPPRWRDLPRLKIGATVSPEGKNGTIEAMWDGRVVKRYDFDNYEDHDVSNTPPAPTSRPDRGGRSTEPGLGQPNGLGNRLSHENRSRLNILDLCLIGFASVVRFRTRVTRSETRPRVTTSASS
jgi:hypothetical protein